MCLVFLLLDSDCMVQDESEKGKDKAELEASDDRSMSNLESGPQGLSRRPSRSAATTTFSTEVFDNEVVPSSLASIAPILRVAKEIEHERPRVAYHCIYHTVNDFINVCVNLDTILFTQLFCFFSSSSVRSVLCL